MHDPLPLCSATPRDQARTAWYLHQQRAAHLLRLEAIAAEQAAALRNTLTGSALPWRWRRDCCTRTRIAALRRYRLRLLAQAVAHQEAALRVALYAERMP